MDFQALHSRITFIQTLVCSLSCGVIEMYLYIFHYATTIMSLKAYRAAPVKSHLELENSQVLSIIALTNSIHRRT